MLLRLGNFLLFAPNFSPLMFTLRTSFYQSDFLILSGSQIPSFSCASLSVHSLWKAALGDLPFHQPLFSFYFLPLSSSPFSFFFSLLIFSSCSQLLSARNLSQVNHREMILFLVMPETSAHKTNYGTFQLTAIFSCNRLRKWQLQQQEKYCKN